MKNNWKEEFKSIEITEKRLDCLLDRRFGVFRLENLEDFIESLLAEQKKESFEEGFNEGKKLVCNGKCSFYNGNLTGYDSGCYVHNLSFKKHE